MKNPLPIGSSENPEDLARRLEREQRAVLRQRETNLEDSLKPFRVGSVPFQIPYPRSQLFVGRDEVLTKLASLLDTETSVAILPAITGVGGIGKTLLAAEFAHCYRHRFPGGSKERVAGPSLSAGGNQRSVLRHRISDQCRSIAGFVGRARLASGIQAAPELRHKFHA